jgi:mono/diheme cytochrome c family protein
MDSNLLARIHAVSVMLFLFTYVVKTILLFSSRTMLDKYSRITKVPEMIISAAFLGTGIWLFVLLDGMKVFHIIKLVLVFVSIPLAVIGFKKYKKGLALLALVLIVGAYGLSEMSKNKPFIPKKVQLSAGSTLPLASGALIYHQNCSFCHGDDGKKKYRTAPDLTLSLFSHDAVMQMIREGSKGKMPPYNIIMSDENISAVADYVIGLRPLPPISGDTLAY